MNILLINPPSSNDNSQISLPLNLLILRQIGYDNNCLVDILDLDFVTKFESLKLSEIYPFYIKNIINKNKYSIIGFTTNCSNYPIVLELSKLIKSENNNLKIFLGGPHSTLVHKKTMELFEFIDFIIIGEGELTFEDLIRNKFINLNKINGIIFRDENNRIIKTNDRQSMENLNQFTLNLNRELIEHYWNQMKRNEIPVFPIEVGRGCPYRCTYCCACYIWNHEYRIKSPKIVVSEILYLNETAGVDKFNFTHDNFTFNKEYVNVLCDLLIKENLKISWNCSSRIDQLDTELISKMRKAGCRGIFFGIESGSKRIQKKIKKNINIEKVISILKEVKKTNIISTVSFILGFPFETKDDLRDTLNLAINCKEQGASIDFNILSPMPKTEIFNYYKNNMLYTEEKHRKLWYIDKDLSIYNSLKENKEIFSFLYFIKNKYYDYDYINYIFLASTILINNMDQSLINFIKTKNINVLDALEKKYNSSNLYHKKTSKSEYFNALYQIYKEGSGENF